RQAASPPDWSSDVCSADPASPARSGRQSVWPTLPLSDLTELNTPPPWSTARTLQVETVVSCQIALGRPWPSSTTRAPEGACAARADGRGGRRRGGAVVGGS